MTTFSARLKAARERKKRKDPKWTQAYAGKVIGVARTTYTAYENGTKEPTIDNIGKMANLFEVTADYLLGRTESKCDPIPENEPADANVEQLMKMIKGLLQKQSVTKATLDIKEAATYLGVHMDTVKKLIREKELPHVRIAGRILLRPGTLDEYMAQQERQSINKEEE